LSVVLAYGAFLLLLRFVMADGPSGRAALGLSIPMIGLGILVQEYALPVVIVMVIFFWSYTRRGPHPETRARALRAIFFSILTAGAAYAIFFIIADYTVRPGWAEVSPFYVFTTGEESLARFPFRLVEGIWRSVVGAFMISMGQVTLTSKSGVMAAAYGALVAGLVFFGGRNTSQNIKSPPKKKTNKRGVFPPALPFLGGRIHTLPQERI